jgi:hypothetical protein
MISWIKKLFCNHKDWIKRDIIVAKPCPCTVNGTMETIKLLALGQTTIVYEYPKCGKLFTISAYGVPPKA